MHLVTFDELKGYIVTDLCGVYLSMSNRGMKYILVLYNYDSNLIAACAMKSNKGAAITYPYNPIYTNMPTLEMFFTSVHQEARQAVVVPCFPLVWSFVDNFFCPNGTSGVC